MNLGHLNRAISILILVPLALTGQETRERELVPLKNWPAPLYWQPVQPEASREAGAGLAPQAATSLPLGTNALVFVAMTPCRVMDTRAGQGFGGAFGPPSIAQGTPVRTIPIQASTTCSIPSVAQAYSFNVTVVPPGQLIYLTLYPATAGSSQPNPPNASTLNAPNGGIVANAAIVPAGTDGQGSVDVYASNATDLIIDINGYYATPGDALGNTALGTGALASNPIGIDNTAVGAAALQLNTTGADNTANGAGALQSNTTGNQNTGVGLNALAKNTSGGNNTAIGATALKSNTTGASNTAAGAAALLNNTTGSQNTAIGLAALQNNTSGGNNTASGVNTLESNTNGTGNTASGVSALASNTGGNQNTASGLNALQLNTSGNNNTATGVDALQSNTIGTSNTATGLNALQANSSGSQNTADGLNALDSNTTGGNNVASGYNALTNNSSGGSNTASGAGALSSNTSGSNNIAIGFTAASSVSGGNSNNIHIGSTGAANDSGAIRIGTPATQTSFYAAGVRGVTTSNSNAVPVMIDSNGQLGTVNSSIRFKEDVEDMAGRSDDLMRLRPVTFRYKQPAADGSKALEYGLIAEEVAEVYPDLVVRGNDGKIETVQYQKLTPMLLNEVQKQRQELSEANQLIRALERRLADLETRISQGGQNSGEDKRR